jgi:hypothetical protein
MSNIRQIRFYLKKHKKGCWRVVLDKSGITAGTFSRKKDASSVCRNFINSFHPQYDWVLCEEKKPEEGAKFYSFSVLAKSKGGLI